MKLHIYISLLKLFILEGLICRGLAHGCVCNVDRNLGNMDVRLPINTLLPVSCRSNSQKLNECFRKCIYECLTFSLHEAFRSSDYFPSFMVYSYSVKRFERSVAVDSLHRFPVGRIIFMTCVILLKTEVINAVQGCLFLYGVIV